MSAAPSKLPTPASASLHIRFAAGERPHVFWVSEVAADGSARIYKILSKSVRGGAVEALLIEEDERGRRRALLRVEVPPDAPSGWLAHWVETAAEELGARFRLYDLRSVETAAEWTLLAAQLGWLREPPQRGPA